MPKYYDGRYNSVVNRDGDAVERNEREPSWFAEFVNNLEKEAVKSKKDDYSLFNQINSILGNKSRYSSVEEAVNDMATRTGIREYLNNKKQASDATDKKYDDLDIFKQIPSLKIFIDNYVEDRPGTSVEAVVHDLLKVQSIKKDLPLSDSVPEEVKYYINDKIKEVSELRNSRNTESLNLGKIDLSTDDDVMGDNDPFRGCTPNKGK